MNSPSSNPRQLSQLDLDLDLDDPVNSKSSLRLRDRAYSDAHAVRCLNSVPSAGADFVSSPEESVAAANNRPTTSTASATIPVNPIKLSPRKSHHRAHAAFSSRPRSKSESESVHLRRARTSPMLKKKIHPVVSSPLPPPPPHGHNFIPMTAPSHGHNHHAAKHSYKSCGKMWIRPSPVGRCFTTAKKRVDGSTSPDSVSDLGGYGCASGYGTIDAVPYLPLLHFSPNSSFDPVVPSSPGESDKRRSASDAKLFAFGESGKPIKPSSSSLAFSPTATTTTTTSSSSSSTFQLEGFRPLKLPDSSSVMEL
ncbi:hypothetical protein ACHAXS_009243 [Conticribra weissflogii]